MSHSTARRLSLFTGPPDSTDLAVSQTGTQLSQGLTLPEFYLAFVLPNVRRLASPRTIEQDRIALRRWAELSGDPPLRGITDALAAEFVTALAARKVPASGSKSARGLSPNTVRKTCTHLQKIVDSAGPKTRHHRRTAELLSAARVPYFERPSAVCQPPVDVYTVEEIGHWLEACALAAQTKSLGGIPAARWWRAIVVFGYNTGLRIETIMGAMWALVDRDRPGWLTVPPAIAKGQRGGLYYLNHAARDAIDRLGTRTLPGFGPIFPWRGWPRSAPWLQACRRRILEKSSLQPGRRFGFHALRKALATFLASRNPMIASIVLGHRGGMTQMHYVDPRIVVRLLERVPQPFTPAAHPHAADARQPLLF